MAVWCAIHTTCYNFTDYIFTLDFLWMVRQALFSHYLTLFCSQPVMPAWVLCSAHKACRDEHPSSCAPLCGCRDELHLCVRGPLSPGGVLPLQLGDEVHGEPLGGAVPEPVGLGPVDRHRPPTVQEELLSQDLMWSVESNSIQNKKQSKTKKNYHIYFQTFKRDL